MRPSHIATLLVALAVPVLFACAAPLEAQVVPAGAPPAPPADSGPPSRGRFLASFPLAALLGTAGAAGGVLAGYVWLGCEDDSASCESGPDNAELLTGAAGLALGAAVGAFLGGLRGDSRGKFWADMLAASGGALPMAASGVSSSEGSTGLFLAGLVAAPLAAAITDHVVRKGRGPRRVSIQPTTLHGPVGFSVTVRY
jgi:hypothetical protein